MSDTKELLELAALAMGYTVHKRPEYSSADASALWVSPNGSRCKFLWAPIHNSGDAAEMCAALGINTTWLVNSVDCRAKRRMRNELFSMHAEDRAAAWRMAALRVAAAIGEAMK